MEGDKEVRNKKEGAEIWYFNVLATSVDQHIS
jgi:hypothetical protein